MRWVTSSISVRLSRVERVAIRHKPRWRRSTPSSSALSTSSRTYLGLPWLWYLEQRTHVLFWGLNRVEEASALLERARSWSDDPGWPKRMEPLRLRFTAEIADSVQALTDVLADEALDPATRLRGERRLAVSLFYAGRVGEARALAARVLPSIPLGDYSDALALGAWRLIEFETAEDWPALDAYMAGVLR